MSNTIVTNFFGILQQTIQIRVDLLDSLTDADLAYSLPGANPTLGALLQEMGEMMHLYNESFQTFRLGDSYAHTPGVSTSVAALQAWFADLDAELYRVLSTLTDEQIAAQVVQRPRFAEAFPVAVHFHTLREAFLIYYGKLSCYLRALEKPLSPQMQNWIG